jgi:crotonobetainyl-CoA:carnitine CoA-transferase CaiB-like acyl-CoA transferase
MSVTGEPGRPTRVGVPIADLLAGMYGAYGVVAALHARERTGRGDVVRTSLLASVVGVHAFHGTGWTVAGQVPQGVGNHHPSIVPYGTFTAADGVVQIAVGSEGLWQKFAPFVGLDAADPRYATNALRVARRAELVAHIDSAFVTEPMGHWLPLLAEIGVPAGEVRTIDRVYEWDQTLSQGLLTRAEHGTLGSISLPGPPLRFDATPARAVAAPPTLGQHNDSVRAWLAGDA